MKDILNLPVIKSIITTIVLTLLTTLPICPIIYRNTQNREYLLNGVSLSLFICLIYSLITPGIVGVIKRNDYNILHKSIIVISVVILVFFMGLTLEDSSIIRYQNQYFECYVLFVALILLFFNTYKEEQGNSNFFEENDKNLQKNLIKYSKNLNSEGTNNE